MNDFQTEIAELKIFIADLKADRAAQKDKEQREAWTKYTSLSIVVLAVLAAVATQWAGKYSSRTLVSLNQVTIHQAEASDQWSFFQAKSIKQNLYELSRDQLQKTGGAPDPALAKALETMNTKIAGYAKDKEDIMKKAKALEAERDLARSAADDSSRHGSGMGMAVSIFQISIALGSICLVVKKKPLWYLALVFGAAATAEMFNVWYGFWK